MLERAERACQQEAGPATRGEDPAASAKRLLKHVQRLVASDCHDVLARLILGQGSNTKGALRDRSFRAWKNIVARRCFLPSSAALWDVHYESVVQQLTSAQQPEAQWASRHVLGFRLEDRPGGHAPGLTSHLEVARGQAESSAGPILSSPSAQQIFRPCGVDPSQHERSAPLVKAYVAAKDDGWPSPRDFQYNYRSDSWQDDVAHWGRRRRA